MLKSDSGSLDNQTIKNMATARTDLDFEPFALVYLLFGTIVTRTAKLLEICDCHSHLWEEKKTRKRRQAAMESSIGRPDCVFMGRRLPWFIAVGFLQLIQSLREAACPELTALLGSLDGPLRTRVTATVEHMKARLIEIYEDKFEWIFHCPYSAIGAFYSTLGGDLARGKELWASATTEYDEAVDAGRAKRMHRVSHRLLATESPIRKSGDEWCAADSEPMWNFVFVYVALLEYALIQAVERRIEAIHAIVHRIGRRTMRGMTLAQICALVREAQNLKALRENLSFERFCLDHWRCRSIFNDILKLRYSATELAAMSTPDKRSAIYQTGRAQEFCNTSAATVEHNKWLSLTASQRGGKVFQSEGLKACVSFLKTVFGKAACHRCCSNLAAQPLRWSLSLTWMTWYVQYWTCLTVPLHASTSKQAVQPFSSGQQQAGETDACGLTPS